MESWSTFCQAKRVTKRAANKLENSPPIPHAGRRTPPGRTFLTSSASTRDFVGRGGAGWDSASRRFATVANSAFVSDFHFPRAGTLDIGDGGTHRHVRSECAVSHKAEPSTPDNHKGAPRKEKE